VESPHLGLLVQSVGDTISLPITIVSTKSDKSTEAKVLIDSGAEGEFIDWGFVCCNQIKLTISINPYPYIMWMVCVK
jgi:hypothetical protein